MQDSNNTINDCWNKIGVWRKDEAECPLLQNVIHCRNCETYINSGLSFLNREFPDNYCNNNTEIYKQAPETNTGEIVSVIIFRSLQNWFALRTSIFVEIDNDKTVHSIPHNKNNVISGLVNIRGELELCISLTSLISHKANNTNETTDKTKLIIIKLESGKYALKPDEILGVYKINNQDIQTSASSITGDSDHMVSGSFDHDKKHIGLIDDDLLNSRLGMAQT